MLKQRQMKNTVTLNDGKDIIIEYLDYTNGVNKTNKKYIWNIYFYIFFACNPKRDLHGKIWSCFAQNRPYVRPKSKLYTPERDDEHLHPFRMRKQANKSPRRKQVSLPARNDDRSPIWNIWRPLISFLFSRINTKDFPYIKGKINWSIGINYSSVNFKWTQVFLCCQSFDRRGQWIF